VKIGDMAPPPTDDFTDCVTDLLTGGSRDDFGSKKYVKAKFKSAEVLSAPVAFTNEVTEKGGKLVGKSSFKWELKQAGITVDKVALDATNGIGALNATVKKTFVPGLQLKSRLIRSKRTGLFWLSTRAPPFTWPPRQGQEGHLRFSRQTCVWGTMASRLAPRYLEV